MKQTLHAVTGAFGYSGKYIAKRLLDRGDEVITLTNSFCRSNPLGGRVQTFEADLANIGKWIVAIGLIFFAYSTMIAWSYYGDRSCEYLFGSRSIQPYRYVFCFFVILGTVGGLDLIWVIADNLNALMAVPNLIALIGLSPLVGRETFSYLRRMREAGEI